MSTGWLLGLIAAAWLTYPFAGATNVAIQVSKGKRPEGAGFSFLPELIIFPPIFYGIAYAINEIWFPIGSWIIATLCVALFVIHIFTICRGFYVLRGRNQNNTDSID